MGDFESQDTFTVNAKLYYFIIILFDYTLVSVVYVKPQLMCVVICTGTIQSC